MYLINPLPCIFQEEKLTWALCKQNECHFRMPAGESEALMRFLRYTLTWLHSEKKSPAQPEQESFVASWNRSDQEGLGAEITLSLIML